jgi:hypothetical protein
MLIHQNRYNSPSTKKKFEKPVNSYTCSKKIKKKLTKKPVFISYSANISNLNANLICCDKTIGGQLIPTYHEH